MQIGIMGAGAVGGHFAARLARAGAAVSVVARNDHLAAIQRDGLRLSVGEETYHAQVAASDQAQDLGVQDVLVVSVKFFDLTAALEQAQPMIGPNTRVVFAMNGLPWWFPQGTALEGDAAIQAQLDPGGQIAARLGVDRSIACVVTAGGKREEPGHIRNTTPHMNRIALGYCDGRQDETLSALAHLAGLGGYSAEMSDNIRQDIWKKLIFNAGLAPVSTIAERTAKQTCRDPETRALAHHLFGEIIAIGQALGLSVQVNADAILDPDNAPDHKPSFLQDLQAGKRLEIQNGLLAVRTIARSLGVSAPHLDTVAALMAARSPIPV
ncbi:MAG: ketopantoate reductase family protein [Pelagimonas sp.]|uniref:ketopantoate reductase family protein n=1 Tax=Pelagimonas sp. TaxID=2073170 RepID=UPI003D6AFADB